MWDVLKIEIRDHTIMYCKNKSKLNRQERRSLKKELNTNKGNNKITELRTILQRESQNS